MSENKESPQIIFLNKEGKQEYYELAGKSCLIGWGEKCHVKLSKKVAEEENLMISYNEAGEAYVATNLGTNVIFLNASTEISSKQRVVLGYKNFFIFGDKSDRNNCTPVVFVDPEKLEEEEIKTKKLSVKQEKEKVLEVEIKDLCNKFFSGLQNVSPWMKEVCKYFTKFIFDKFPISTIVLYKKSGASWETVGSYRRNKSELYRPSSFLFKKAVESNSPIYFKVEPDGVEIQDNLYEASVSIIESGAKRVILTPLSQNGNVVGMLYVDGKDEELLTEKEFQVLNHSLSSGGILGTLAGYLAEEKDCLEFLKISNDILPKKWGWRFSIGNHQIHFPIVSFKAIEDDGRARLVYGACGNDVELVSKMKSFIEGLQFSSIKGSSGVLFPDFYHSANEFYSFLFEKQLRKNDLKFFDVAIRFPANKDLKLETLTPGEDNSYKVGDYSLEIKSMEGFFAYSCISGKMEDVDKTKPNKRLIGFGIGDFLVVSQYVIPSHILKNINESRKKQDHQMILHKLRMNVKDFLILIREK